MNKKIHIVCWDVPYPANYGGAIEEFYKIKYLAEAGADIQLHCFLYGGREPQDELKKYCSQVFYYQRKNDITGISLKLPFIVKSRDVDELLLNLQKNNSSILFDGIHTTYFLNHESLDGRFKIVRPQNIEHQYYKHLGEQESNLVKKGYFMAESKLLEKYEKNRLKPAQAIVSVAKQDFDFFQKCYPDAHHEYLPCFHSNESVSSTAGKSDYFLYHGSLQVSENVIAVKFLIQEVFNDLDEKLVIAGRNIDKEIIKLVEGKKNIQFIDSPTPIAMDLLLKNAQAHVLPTFQATGLKLKLLNALFNGRFCIANKKMINGTHLKNEVYLAEGADEWKKQIRDIAKMEFTDAHIEKRKQALQEHFDVKQNAHTLYNLIQ